jgi:tetratricopeptide (TPR) repeat protein
MRKVIFSLLVVSSAVFGNNIDEANSHISIGLENYNLAIENFTKAIELNPNDFYLYSFRGDAYVEIGYYNLAINDYTKSIKLNPNDSNGYNGRGVVYGLQGNYKSAIKDAKKGWDKNQRIKDVHIHSNDVSLEF